MHMEKTFFAIMQGNTGEHGLKGRRMPLFYRTQSFGEHVKDVPHSSSLIYFIHIEKAIL